MKLGCKIQRGTGSGEMGGEDICDLTYAWCLMVAYWGGIWMIPGFYYFVDAIFLRALVELWASACAWETVHLY